MTMTADEKKRFDLLVSFGRTDMLKFARSMRITAHSIKSDEELAYMLIRATRSLHEERVA